MTTTNNTEIQELKQFISDRFNQLDRKLDETKSELKQDISDLKGDLKALHVEVKGLEKRLSNVEISANKIPEITEKFGELKNWRQTAFVIIAGVVSAFLGWLARGGKV
ncbi:MAG: DUF1664 domain-containing protein [Waterburya sp.]